MVVNNVVVVVLNGAVVGIVCLDAVVDVVFVVLDVVVVLNVVVVTFLPLLFFPNSARVWPM